jgi:hypothetical protein
MQYMDHHHCQTFGHEYQMHGDANLLPLDVRGVMDQKINLIRLKFVQYMYKYLTKTKNHGSIIRTRNHDYNCHQIG